MSDLPQDLRRVLEESGVSVSDSRNIDYGRQYRLARGGDKVTLNVYRTGKVSIGGKSSSLKTLLEDWKTTRSGPGRGEKQGTEEASGGVLPRLDRRPRVGTDEAGKGDYFGSLVVAGVRVPDGRVAENLQKLGVRDSKDLTRGQALRLAKEILVTVGTENVQVQSLPPQVFEARRTAAGNNVNRLLGELNVEILSELKDQVEAFVVDEFARAARSYIEPAVPPGVSLEVRPRAEDDAAVAAASILARARFLEDMAGLSEVVGFELPLGATHVHAAARRVVKEWGVEGLARVAKVSFSTTKKVLGAAGRSG